jgi:gliding motility-associated-like protein
MKTLVYIFFILAYGAVDAQHTFIKTTSDANFGIYMKVLPMNDNGWVVCSLDSFKISKFDNCGNIEWSKRYLRSATTFGFYDVTKTSDDGIAFITINKSGSQNTTQLTKLDAGGTILWSKTYSISNYDHEPLSITEDQAGNLLITSFVWRFNGGLYAGHTLLIKTDSAGNTFWSHFYNLGMAVWGPSLSTSDGGILICQWGLFTKLDSNGVVEWNYFDPTDTSYNFVSCAVEVSDGYIYSYSSRQYPNVVFNKIDKFGNQRWSSGKMVNYSATGQYLTKKSNGNFAAVFDQTQSTSNTVIAVEFDKDLNVVSQNAFSGPGSTLIGRGLCFLADNTPIIVGNIDTSAAIFVAKTDPVFKLDCSTGFDPISTIPVTIISQAHTVASFSVNLATVSQNASSSDYVNATTLICSNPKNLDLGNDTAVCPAAMVTLSKVGSDVFDHYRWSTGDTTNSITTDQPGVYWLSAYDECELYIYSDTIIISNRIPFDANLGVNKILCENDIIGLKVDFCDSCRYAWSTGSTSDSIEVTTPGTYSLTVQNKFGCISGDTIAVDTAKCECDLYLPNAFTPNDDGLNEIFLPRYYCDYTSYQFSIYNHWGQKVFESDEIEKGWNGKMENQFAPEGLYIYTVSYTPIVRKIRKDEIRKTGPVAVIY